MVLDGMRADDAGGVALGVKGKVLTQRWEEGSICRWHLEELSGWPGRTLKHPRGMDPHPYE